MTASAPASSPTSPAPAMIAIDDTSIRALAKTIARVTDDAGDCGCIDPDVIAEHVAGLHHGTSLAHVQQSVRGGTRKDLRLVIRCGR